MVSGRRQLAWEGVGWCQESFIWSQEAVRRYQLVSGRGQWSQEEVSDGLMKVSVGLGIKSDCLGNVSDGFKKVSLGLRKGSNDLRNRGHMFSGSSPCFYQSYYEGLKR